MNSTTLLIPAAGKSSRYSTDRPKWQLTHPSGDLMLVKVISGLDMSNVSEIVITVVEEHINKVNLDKLKQQITELTNRKVRFIILQEFTSSQAETVHHSIVGAKLTGSIFVKDCDNFFEMTPSASNGVATAYLTDDINAVNKSYVEIADKYNKIKQIVEKKIIGNQFCVGGYSFADAKQFCQAFAKINNQTEVYLSHVVQKLIQDKINFYALPVKEYHDWGTEQDWLRYVQQYKTIFCDLDGVLVTNGSAYFSPGWEQVQPLQANIDALNNFSHAYVVITTARPESCRDLTERQLQRFGIRYQQLVMGLPAAGRILINDFSTTNRFPSAIAINVERNGNKLKDYL